MISFAPLLPWPVCAAIFLLCAVAAFAAILLRARGGLLRLLGFALLALILSGPHYVAETSRPLPDIVVVAVDHSQSMAIGSRAAMAARALARLKAQAAAMPDLQLREVDIPPAADDGTPLFAELSGAMADVPQAQRAGLILITDGEISDTPARNPYGAPLSALLTAKGEETDRELRLTEAPSYGMVGQKVTLGFTVIDHGANDAGTLVPVTVAADGTRIWSKSVPVGTPVTLGLPVRHAGPATISIQAAPLPGEVSAVNDQAAFTLTGVRKRLEVLLISGNPNEGERTWRVLLKSDPAVQLVHFTILRTPGEIMDALPSELALVPFPVEELFNTDIGKFDLIILDQFNATGLLPPEYLANIARRVKQGGALLVEVGPEFASDGSLAFTPLGPLLPAVPATPGTVVQPFRPRITALGARHPVTAPFAGHKLAPWYRQEMATRTAGDVLLTGIGGSPLLILAHAGQGRVGLLLSDQFWIWTRGGKMAGPALPLLRRCVHWLLNEPALEAESLTASIAHGRLTIRRRTLGAGYPGDAAVTAPDGTQSTLTLRKTAPGRYAASMAADEPGVWRVREGDLSADTAQAAENAAEYRDLAATAARLGPANVFWLGRGMPPLSSLVERRHAAQVTSERDIPLLPPFPMMILALALLAGAWWRERN